MTPEAKILIGEAFQLLREIEEITRELQSENEDGESQYGEEGEIVGRALLRGITGALEVMEYGWKGPEEE